jgi:hypothetical protein
MRLARKFERNDIWCDTAVPQLSDHCWLLCPTDAPWKSGVRLATPHSRMISCNLTQQSSEIGGPGRSCKNSIRYKLVPLLASGDDPRRDETVRVRPVTAGALTPRRVRNNSKQTTTATRHHPMRRVPPPCSDGATHWGSTPLRNGILDNSAPGQRSRRKVQSETAAVRTSASVAATALRDADERN